MKNFLRQIMTMVLSASPALLTAIPTTITISGHLTDAEGAHVLGQYAAQVRVYDTETKDNLIQSFDTTVTANFGYFSGSVSLPGNILLMNEIWYSFGVDLDKNGLDEDDFFDEVYQMTSVPFALQAKPVSFFETHGGHTSGSTTFNLPPHTVFVSPFSTPQGGVTFNRIGYRIGRFFSEEGGKFMVGIYDDSGDLVYSSPVTQTKETSLFSWEVEGHLEASKMYYTAIWTDNHQKIAFYGPGDGIPSLPTGGVLYLGGDDDGLKQDLNFNSINPELVYRPVSITLFSVNEDSPEKLKKHDGAGIDHKKKKIAQAAGENVPHNEVAP